MPHDAFSDRRAAGRVLAEILQALKLEDSPVVLALPRGGVPVAAEIAERLKAPLDLLLVRKLGAPRQAELAIGAIVDGAAPDIVLNEDLVAELGVGKEEIRAIAERERVVLEARRARYVGDRSPERLTGRTVILVDDGIATGATMRAAVKGVRRQAPKMVIVAAPVASKEALAELLPLVDAVVVPSQPRRFTAVGAHYEDFTQVEDEEVVRLMRRASRNQATH